MPSNAGLLHALPALLGKRGGDELFPFRHVGALFRFSTMQCLAVMLLAAGILQRVVLEAVADFLRDPRLAGHRLECPAQVLASV